MRSRMMLATAMLLGASLPGAGLGVPDLPPRHYKHKAHRCDQTSKQKRDLAGKRKRRRGW